MAKALSNWERSVRERERERERSRASSERASERDRAARHRAREREQVRHERASERAAVRRERERALEKKRLAKEEQIDVWQEEVAGAAAYREALTQLHALPGPLSDASSRYAALERSRVRSPHHFIPAPFAETLSLRPFAPASFDRIPYASSIPTRLVLVALFIGGGGLMLTSEPAVPVGAAFAGLVLAALSSFALRRSHEAGESLRFAEHDARDALEKVSVDAENARRRKVWEERGREHAIEEALRRAWFDRREVMNDRLFASREEERTEVLAAARGGDASAITLVLEALLPLATPVPEPPDDYVEEPLVFADLEVAYAVGADRVVQLVVNAPAMTAVPIRESTMTASGERIRYKEISERTRKEAWRECAESVALAHAVAVLGAAPAVVAVDLELWAEAVDPANGHQAPCCLLTSHVTRTRLEAIRMDSAVASAVFTQLGCKRGQLVASGRGHVPRRIEEDGLVWSRSDADQDYVPAGLTHGYPPRELRNEFAKRDPKRWALPERIVAGTSLAAAVQGVRPGGIVELPDGIWREAVRLDSPVTLRARNSGKAVIECGDGDPIHCVSVAVHLCGLALHATGRGGDAVYVSGGEITLEQCDLVADKGSGFVLWESNGEVQGGAAHNCGASGVVVSRRGVAVVRAMRVHGNARAGILVRSDTEATVADCRIDSNGYEAIRVHDGAKVRVVGSDLRGNHRGAFDLAEGCSLDRGEGVVE